MSGKPSICRICKENCGILVSENGHGIEIAGNPDHPVSRGFLCFRGKNYAEVHSSPERLKLPLRRKGSGWEEISYAQALEVLAEGLEKCKARYGAQSVVFYKGESLKHQEIADYLRHLAYGFGSPNYITVGSLCYHALALGFGLTLGGIPQPDLERMQLALFWGANPAVSAPRVWSGMKKSAQAGAKVIAIDPARTQTAARADLHLPIVPGSDGFLALGFIKYGVERAGVAPSFPQTGWPELERHVRSLSFAEVLERTGIEAAAFDAACTLLYAHRPGWIQAGLGLELQPSGVQTIRAIAALQSLLDPDNRPGAGLARLAPLPGADRYPEMPAPIGAGEAPIFTKEESEGQGMYLRRAILESDPYPVRGMLVAGGNPLLTFPGSGLQRKVFEALDFLAVFDLFMTPTAQQANLVLPAAGFLENLELHDYGSAGRPHLGLVRPVVSDRTGWPAWKLIFDLAERLGLKELFPWHDNEEALRYRLGATGITFEALMESPAATVSYTPAKRAGWNTSDGTVHYRCELLEKAGYPPVPMPNSLGLPLTTDTDYPLWLSSGDRLPFFQHSQFRGIPAHRAAMREPRLDMHPDAARRIGIEDGEPVWLATRCGRIEVRSKLDAGLRSDCLRLSHGWIEANANELTDSFHFDPISGFPWMRALPARVERKGG